MKRFQLSRLPFDISHGGYKFYIAYIYQTISIWTAGAYYVGCNSVLYSLMTLTDYQVTLLGNRLSKFGYEPTTIDKKLATRNNYKQIVAFVEMHMEIQK